MNFEPHWLRVLAHFQQSKYVYNGLTIPFLIGSELLHNPSRGDFTVSEIINQMQDENLKSPISVMTCNTIGDYVFGILDQESIKENLRYTIYRSFSNLSITDDSFRTFYDLERIVTELEGRYGENISRKEYSKHYGQWTKFNVKESARILEL